MKEEKSVSLNFFEYTSLNDLSQLDQKLLYAAIEASKVAYAPYSEFKVGAAVLLQNGEIVKGSNQENAAYPSGLCAERVTLFSASANYPDEPMQTIAIYADQESTDDQPVSPCGACRQVMDEYEQKQEQVLRVLLMNSGGKIWEFHSMNDLLPFAFRFKSFKKSNS